MGAQRRLNNQERNRINKHNTGVFKERAIVFTWAPVCLVAGVIYMSVVPEHSVYRLFGIFIMLGWLLPLYVYKRKKERAERDHEKRK